MPKILETMPITKPADKKNGKVEAKVIPDKEKLEKVSIKDDLAEQKKKNIYPAFETLECWGEGAISMETMKEIMGWRTESEWYKQKKLDIKTQIAIDETTGKSIWDEFLLKDEFGEKVKCYRDAKNRPFEEQHARKLAQDILSRNWAGPTTMPGETVNGETFIISRTGQVTSGQHRGIGFILACQMWHNKDNKRNAHYKDLWREEPVFETLLVRGASDSPKVTRTLDNVKPRTLGDVFYVAQEFSDLDSIQRKECTRMMAKAVELLWKRTGVGSEVMGGALYATHSETTAWLMRHEKLKECVRHIFEENKERDLTGLKLSPGQCAAMMYLMASSKSDGDVYRNADPPSEKDIDFEYFDDAKKFWVELAGGNAKEGNRPQDIIAQALAQLVDEDTLTGGRMIEKQSLLARAWGHKVSGNKITMNDLELTYYQDDDGMLHLVPAEDYPDFGGIDLGPKYETIKDVVAEPTEEELEKQKEETRKANAELLRQKAEEARRKREAAQPSATIGAPGSKDGKPPAPKLSRAAIEKAQTEKARKNDEEDKKATKKGAKK